MRTPAFALRVIRLAESLPSTRTAAVIRKQMIRCGSSVQTTGPRAGAKSAPDFVSKPGTVEEEADETIYWIELLIDARLVERDRVAKLLDESNQILSIMVSSIKTARNSGATWRRNPHSAI